MLDANHFYRTTLVDNAEHTLVPDVFVVECKVKHPALNTFIKACDARSLQAVLLDLNTLFLNERQSLKAIEASQDMIRRATRHLKQLNVHIETTQAAVNELNKSIHELEDAMLAEKIHQQSQYYLLLLQERYVSDTLKYLSFCLQANKCWQTSFVDVHTTFKVLQKTMQAFNLKNVDLLQRFSEIAISVCESIQTNAEKALKHQQISLEQRFETLQTQCDAANNLAKEATEAFEEQSETIVYLHKAMTKQKVTIEQLNEWIESLERDCKKNLVFENRPYGGARARLFKSVPSDTDKDRCLRYYRQQNAWLKMRLSQRCEIIEKLQQGEGSATLSLS